MSGIAVVVVNHDTREHLRACLEAVLSQDPAEVVAVLVASSDGSAAMVRDRFPAVRVQAHRRNLGYGDAANRGIATCESRFVLLLNADTRLRPRAAPVIARYLAENPEVAAVGPRLLDPDTSLQPSCFHFPSPGVSLANEAGLRFVLRHLPGLRQLYLRTWSHDRPRALPWVSGAALGIRREAFEAVGGFDPGYFMYFEETDLCFRLWEAGWRVHFVPTAEVVHYGGASTGRRPIAMRAAFYASLRRFYRLHRTPGQERMLELLIRGRAMLSWAVRRGQALLVPDPERRETLRAEAEGWRELIGQRPGRHDEGDAKTG